MAERSSKKGRGKETSWRLLWFSRREVTMMRAVAERIDEIH